jgi:hypothetical protein
MMKQFCSFCLAVLVMVLGSRASAAAASSDRPPLRLVQTIRMTNIGGGEPDVPPEQLAKEAQTTRMTDLQNHFDHFEVDLKRQRLFITPEDNKSVEVYDLRSGELVHSIRGIGTAHAVLYRRDLDELFVTDGTEDSLKIFSGKDYRFTKTVKLLTDADSMGYDPDSHSLYIDRGDGRRTQLLFAQYRRHEFRSRGG